MTDNPEDIMYRGKNGYDYDLTYDHSNGKKDDNNNNNNNNNNRFEATKKKGKKVEVGNSMIIKKKTNVKNRNVNQSIFSIHSYGLFKPETKRSDIAKIIKFEWFQFIDKIKKLDFGLDFVVALYTDGTVAMHSENDRLKLPVESKSHAKSNQIPKLYDIIDISCTKNAIFALTNTGDIFIYGKINDDSLSKQDSDIDQDFYDVPTILRKDSELTVIQIATGNDHLVALCDTGEVLSYGNNMSYQCGMTHQSFFNHLTPIPTLRGTLIIGIYVGGNHCFAKNNCGKIYAWGNNIDQQCCFNSKLRYLRIPTQIEHFRNIHIDHIWCSQNHSLFKSSDGTIYGCGSGVYGQLGISVSTFSSRPVNILDLNDQNITDLCIGNDLTMASSSQRFMILGDYLKGSRSVFTEKNFNNNNNNNNNNDQQDDEDLDSDCFMEDDDDQDLDEFFNDRLFTIDLSQSGNYRLINIASRFDNFAIILANAAESKSEEENAKKNLLIENCAKLMHSHTYNRPTPYVLTKEILENARMTNHCFETCQKIISSPQNFSGSFWLKSLILERPQYSKKISNDSYGVENDELKKNNINNDPSIANSENDLDDRELNEVSKMVDFDFIKYSMEFLSKKMPHHEHAISNSFYILSELLLYARSLDSVISSVILFEYRPLDNFESVDFAMHMHTLRNNYRAILSFDRLKLDFFFKLYINNDIKIFERAVELSRNYAEKVLTEMHQRHNYRSLRTMTNFSPHFESQMMWKFINLCLKVLKIFYDLNSSVPKRQALPIEKWQLSNDIYKYINITTDYENFFSTAHFGNISVNHSNFSYMNFPFLLNTEMKSIVLKYNNALELNNLIISNNNNNNNQNDNNNNNNNSNNNNQQYLTIDKLVIIIDRKDLIASAISALKFKESRDLKRPLMIQFLDEDGEDEGGVSREFFSLFIQEIFDTQNRQFFVEENESNLFWFHANASKNFMWVIGIVFALAIYNSYIINAPLPLVVYKKLLEIPMSSLDDLEELKPETSSNLRQLLEYSDNDFQEVFGLYFTIELPDSTVVELIEDGANKPVTKFNKMLYVEKIIDYYLNTSVENAFMHFKSGFYKVLTKKSIQILEPTQLQELLVGNEIYDFGVLKECCEYLEGYYANNEYIKRFWRVFDALHVSDKTKFLVFLTGCGRLPFNLKLFKIRIRRTLGGDHYLPVAHTCANMLDLPEYQDDRTMRKKLLRAIYESSGFTLA